MSSPISFGGLDFNLVASMEATRTVPEAETPFRMLVIGDSSGRVNRGLDKSANPLTGLKPIQVDRDTLDEALGRLEVKIELPLPGEKTPPVQIKFSELDDFHQDVLYQTLDVFKALRDTRESLYDPSTFAAFVKEPQAQSPPKEKTE